MSVKRPATMPLGTAPAPIAVTCSGSTTAVMVVVRGLPPATVTSCAGCLLQATTIGVMADEKPKYWPETSVRTLVFSKASRSASADCEGGAPLKLYMLDG